MSGTCEGLQHGGNMGEGKDNGRITLAVLASKMDDIVYALNRHDDHFDALHKTMDEKFQNLLQLVQDAQVSSAVNKQATDHTAKQLADFSKVTQTAIESLNNRVNAWNGGNTFLATVAGILAIIMGNKQ